MLLVTHANKMTSHLLQKNDEIILVVVNVFCFSILATDAGKSLIIPLHLRIFWFGFVFCNQKINNWLIPSILPSGKVWKLFSWKRFWNWNVERPHWSSFRWTRNVQQITSHRRYLWNFWLLTFHSMVDFQKHYFVLYKLATSVLFSCYH